MFCPSCRSEMAKLEFRGTEVDQCGACRGLWLDLGEIDRLFALPEVPERLTNIEQYRQPDQSIKEGHRTCPRCKDFLKVIDVDGIHLDACSQCKGFFCDLGELAKLEAAAEQRYRYQHPDA